MAEFNPDKDYSEIRGSSLYKWIQDGVYFDKNFEPISSDAKEQIMPVVELKREIPKATAIPREIIGKVDDAE